MWANPSGLILFYGLCAFVADSNEFCGFETYISNSMIFFSLYKKVVIDAYDLYYIFYITHKVKMEITKNLISNRLVVYSYTLKPLR